MSETLEYPTIAEDKTPALAPSASVAVVSIKDATLARFTATETALRKLAERYSRVAFNVQTPKGLAEAKAARNELREQGRYAVQRIEKVVKDDVNDLKRIMASEAARLIAIVKPVEDAVDAQIKAREEALAAEKAERERIEAERVARHHTNLTTLRSYVAQGKGKTSDQLTKAAAAVSAIGLDPEAWEEFHDQAVNVRAQVHEELSRMAAEAKVREDERAEAERLRAENMRILAAQKAEADRIAAERAEIERERAELAAQRAKAARKEYTEALGSQQVLKAEAATPDATDRDAPADASPVGGPMGVEQPAAAGLADADKPMYAPLRVFVQAELVQVADPVADEKAKPFGAYDGTTLTLDELGDLLGFDLPAAFVCNTLGVKLSKSEPVRFLITELPRVFAGLRNHLTQLENETC